MIGRPRDGDGDSTSARLIALTARHDQALTIIDHALHANAGNRQLVDELLDIKNALNPPRR